MYDVQYGENVGTLATPSHSAKSVVGGFAHQGWILGLDFDEEGKNLVSCGFDKCVRVWNLETSEREATINISITDLDDDTNDDQQDESVASGVKFIGKGVRGELVVIAMKVFVLLVSIEVLDGIEKQVVYSLN